MLTVGSLHQWSDFVQLSDLYRRRKESNPVQHPMKQIKIGSYRFPQTELTNFTFKESQIWDMEAALAKWLACLPAAQLFVGSNRDSSSVPEIWAREKTRQHVVTGN